MLILNLILLYLISIEGKKQCATDFYKEYESIIKHNHEYKLGRVTFSRTFTRAAIATSLQPFHLYDKDTKTVDISSYVGPLPETKDWRKEGHVTQPENQGKCSSCWAFASASAIESHYSIKYKKLLNLSAQHILDCAESFNNKGCEGGYLESAFDYVSMNRGINNKTVYPYEGVKKYCRSKILGRSGKINGFVKVPENDEDALQRIIAFIGPVASGMDATRNSFVSYRSGVYYDKSCNSKRLTHAVLIVGYGIERNKPYWLVKNSLGTDWGEGGYFKIMRNKGSHCGIALRAVYPIID